LLVDSMFVTAALLGDLVADLLELLALVLLFVEFLLEVVCQFSFPSKLLLK